MLRQGVLEQNKQARPSFFGELLVVNFGVWRTPPMASFVDLNLRRQVGLSERVLQHILSLWFSLVIVFGNANQKLRFHLGYQQMRTIGFLGDESTAVKRASGADAFGYYRCGSHNNWTTHAISDRTDLLLRIGLRLSVEPRH